MEQIPQLTLSHSLIQQYQ